ncbi:MAG: hypothetical protein IKB93_07695, partial [Clostridia bacterium]|nr:hypothetical protein [Clostridia bacterium]
MKKRILSILTVMAMLLSMCAVSVYAEDVDLTKITAPVTYNYTYRDDSGSKLETQTNVFGRTGDSYKVSYEEKGNKNLKVGNAVGTTTNNIDDKSISSGQKIKVSLKAAGDSWNPGNVTLYLGIGAKVGTETKASNYSLKINNSTGGYIAWGSSLTKTTIDEDKFTKIPIPNKTWVQYDVVFSVY